MEQFIHPNWHVILIHYPLGLIGLGLLIEIFSFLWRRSSVRAAGRWMLLLGILLAIPAITTGLYAFRDAVGGPEDAPWRQVKSASQWNAEQWEMMEDHVLFNSIGVGIMVLGMLAYLGCSNEGRQKLYYPVIITLLIGMGLLAIGAWHGGEAVYRYGTAVSVSPAAKAELAAEHAADDSHTQGFAARITRYVPPLQAHVLMAGLTVAMALAALGLSMRALAAWPGRAALRPAEPYEAPPSEPRTETTVVNAGEGMGEETVEMAPERTPPAVPSRVDDSAGTPVVVDETREYPPARFWLLAALLAIVTALGGAWAAGVGWHDLREMVQANWRQRLSMHLIFGASIIVLALILAGVTRWARTNRWAVWIFSVLIVLAVAAQVWIGILLLFDTSEGSLLRFQ